MCTASLQICSYNSYIYSSTTLSTSHRSAQHSTDCVDSANSSSRTQGMSIRRGKSVLIHSIVQPSLTPLRYAPKQTLLKLNQLWLVVRSADSIVDCRYFTNVWYYRHCLRLVYDGSYHLRYIVIVLSVCVCVCVFVRGGGFGQELLGLFIKNNVNIA